MIRRSQKILIVCFALVFLAGCGAAQTPAQTTLAAHESSPPDENKASADGLMQVAGQIGGSARAVAAGGRYAYVGIGLRMTVVDVSDPAGLMEMGSTEPLGGPAEDISVLGDIAYISAGSAGLYAVDISDPLQPKALGRYDTMGYAQSAAISGKYAYVADGPDGLRVIDITDPADMKETGCAYEFEYAFDAAAAGGYVYIAAAGSGMLAADVSDPSKPVEKGSCETAGYAYGIAVSGDTAYVAGGWEGLRAIDITDPADPKETGAYDTYGWAMDVKASGGRLYAAAANGGLRIFDISKRSPEDLGCFAVTGSHFQCIAISGDTVYAADTRQGMHIIDASNPSEPYRTGLYSPIGWAQAVEVSGDHAYVAAHSFGMRVIDITDNTRPREVSAYDTGGIARAIALGGDTAYVHSWDDGSGDPSGLFSIDVTDPLKPSGSSPVELAGKSIIMCSRNLYADGSVLYNSGEWGALLLDISDPAAPEEACFIQTAYELDPDSPTTVSTAISENLIYIAASRGGLMIYDISDTESPALLSRFSEPIPPMEGKKPAADVNVMDVALSGNYAYIADYNYLRVIDVSDPKDPQNVSALQLPMNPVNAGGSPAKSLAVYGDMLLVADSAAGLLAIDVSDPADPKISQQLSLGGHASWLSLAGDYVYVVAEEGGLYIVSLTSGSSPDQTGETPGPPAAVKISQPADAACGSQYDPLSLLSRKPLEFRAGDFGAGKTLKVTSIDDGGPGTLRECLEKAASGDTIIFDAKVFPANDPATIYLKSGLTLNIDGVTIDASGAGVILDGSGAPSDAGGLNIGSSYNKVMGLQILNFPNCGVNISGSYNTIGGDRSRGAGPMGEGNLISSNKIGGIGIGGENAVGNRIIGNYVGTDATGIKALGNQATGITLSSHDNIIGGPDEADRNVISGNTTMDIECKGATRSVIEGNFIGTDAAGEKSINGNAWGIQVWAGSANNRVEGNVVMGCVSTCDPGSSYNEIIGNSVGADASGLAALQDNSYVYLALPFNRAGGTEPDERNIVNGLICVAGTSDCILINNYVGLDASGGKAFGNGGFINMSDGAAHNIVGGPAQGNYVIGQINVSNTSKDNFIMGNSLGVYADGSAAGSGDGGIFVTASENNTVQCNLVEGTGGSGICLSGNAQGNLIRANNVMKNNMGVSLQSASRNIIIGNDIEYCKDNGGIALEGGSDANLLQYNRVCNNSKCGVRVIDGSGNTFIGNDFTGNDVNAADNGKDNLWDGNHWSDYTGQDSDKDGIGDAPYSIPSNGVDNYPMMAPYLK